MTATNPPSWGAKRARSAPGGRAAASRWAGSSSSCCTRDWANLGGEGPAGLISELALASDLADYVRFRAVCRSWRRCSPDPRDAGLHGRCFLPRRWIKLDKALAGPRRHRFLNVSTGECIRMDLPELAEAPSTGCWRSPRRGSCCCSTSPLSSSACSTRSHASSPTSHRSPRSCKVGAISRRHEVFTCTALALSPPPPQWQSVSLILL
ncbi:hypothetical protein BAE44_0010455 [Dichanthelium oligosanthes]|uniref:F-box domain-containing protein n=1 Tax=Dichanthelium oligosanthes TaxID=888268 RepID=A0A1E5VTT2_9POAL|nr:hypothetical protein BAE44_0010455 [Dichanthelium oligosanthes]